MKLADNLISETLILSSTKLDIDANCESSGFASAKVIIYIHPNPAAMRNREEANNAALLLSPGSQIEQK